MQTIFNPLASGMLAATLFSSLGCQSEAGTQGPAGPRGEPGNSCSVSNEGYLSCPDGTSFDLRRLTGPAGPAGSVGPIGPTGPMGSFFKFSNSCHTIDNESTVTTTNESYYGNSGYFLLTPFTACPVNEFLFMGACSFQAYYPPNGGGSSIPPPHMALDVFENFPNDLFTPGGNWICNLSGYTDPGVQVKLRVRIACCEGTP